EKLIWGDARLPSGATLVALSSQRSPSCVQRPSENPPPSSNVQERMQPSIGSQPMICHPSSVVSAPRFTVTLRVRKLPPRAQLYWLRTVRLSPLSESSQSPTNHPSSDNRSWAVTSGCGVSTSWLIFHLPSFLTETAVYSAP